MELTIDPGKYVVAVSGGVDSVVLLDMFDQHLRTKNEIQPTRLIVAHFDHGMRTDSQQDRQLVAELAKGYGYPFVYQNGKLGKGASEEAARTARYAFLREVKRSANASKIVTAHHSDDALETAIFNLLRGTGRRGVTLAEYSEDIWRPLLSHTKKELYDYATKHNLKWHEDSTNYDTSYSRNYIRNALLKKVSDKKLAKFQQAIGAVSESNSKIDALLANIFHLQPSPSQIERRSFARLPHVVAKEFLVFWLRQNGVFSMDTKGIERLTVAIKTGLPGSQYDVVGGRSLTLTVDKAWL